MTIFSDEGLTIPTFEETLEGVRSRFKTAFGDTCRVDDVDGVTGRLAAIIAEVKDEVLTELAATVAALLPSTSQGTLLEELVKFNGITRNVASYSTAIVTVTANTAGCTIPAGSIVGTATGVQFETDSECVLGSEESDDITVTAVEEGAQEAAAGTITEIITPVYGWASVTNAADATPGNARESDPVLRARRWASAVATGPHSAGAIRKALLDLDGVTQAYVEVNDGATTNENGVPAHHIRAIVYGGTDQDIADTLFGPGAGSVAAGVGTYGDESVECYDEDSGQEGTIYFQRAEPVSIYITVRTHRLTGQYPNDGDAQIKQALLDFFAGDLEINDVSVEPFGLGDDVVSSRLYTAANAVPGHHVREIWISRIGTPTGDDDVEIATHEFATLVEGNITVVHTG